MHTNRKKRPQGVDELLSESDKLKKSEGCSNISIEEKVITPDDSEATIIASPSSEETIVEQSPKQELKTSSESASANYYSPEPDAGSVNEESGMTSGTKIILAVLIGIVVIFVIIGTRGCGNEAQEPAVQQVEKVENTGPKVVTRMQYETAIGGCQYSGPVDDFNKPNGNGEAFFNDGRYYKGGFDHGALSGDDCYFKYPEGDDFKGKFRNNFFYYGRYTVAKDKSYFIGYFDEKGQAAGGTWYDKNNKVIQ